MLSSSAIVQYINRNGNTWKFFACFHCNNQIRRTETNYISYNNCIYILYIRLYTYVHHTWSSIYKHSYKVVLSTYSIEDTCIQVILLFIAPIYYALCLHNDMDCHISTSLFAHSVLLISLSSIHIKFLPYCQIW